MKKSILIMIAVAILAVGQNVIAQDPGIPDTLELIGDTIYLNQSTPIDLRIQNDMEINIVYIGLQLLSEDGANVRLDSCVFINRMSDPTVLNNRSIEYLGLIHDNQLPDSLLFYGYYIIGNKLPPGDNIVARAYFTGLNPGTLTIDSLHVGPGMEFDFLWSENFVTQKYEPQFSALNLVVAEGVFPPVLEFDSLHYSCFAGEPLNIDFNASSPNGYSVTGDYTKFSGYDSPLTPTNLPVISNSSLNWLPTLNDIGIWEVTLRICDEQNNCTQKTITVQVLENADYYSGFVNNQLELVTLPLSLTMADIDNDPPEEIILSCFPQNHSQSLTIMAYDKFNDTLNEVYHITEANMRFHAVAGYINKDKWLDLVCYYNLPEDRKHEILLNDQNNDFDISTSINNLHLYVGAALIDLNDDKYLDYVALGKYDLYTFEGAADYDFSQISNINFIEEIMSLQAQDFDFDGDNDLAIGSLTGLYIFDNNGAGYFSQKDYFPQSFEATDIGIANNGSDFNNDGNYDLYVAAPSVGGDSSLLIIYSNDGSGNYSKSYEKQVVGQVFGNVVIDVNQDGKLDIVYINGAKNYFSILYGDDNGSFTNEQRVFMNHSPANIAASDMDSDGDMDLIFSTHKYNNTNYLILYKNGNNPSNVAQIDFEITGCNNAEIELVAPNGSSLNKVKNGLSSFSSSLINIDDSEQLDKIIKAPVVENGRYDLYLTPKAGLEEGAPFDLEYKINEESFRLAQDAPMSPTGYHFVIAPDGYSSVLPIPGQFIYEQPLFQWSGGGEYNFQLATDIQFKDIILDTIVSGNSCSVGEELSVTDTTMYFWRVKETASPNFTTVNPFNLYYRIPTGVDDDILLPGKFYLAQNYPNPFNPSTTIEFNLPRAEFVELSIYNMLGQKVKTLANEKYDAGVHKLIWDGENDQNIKVASGLYMYKLTAGSNTAMKKMILLK